MNGPSLSLTLSMDNEDLQCARYQGGQSEGAKEMMLSRHYIRGLEDLIFVLLECLIIK